MQACRNLTVSYSDHYEEKAIFDRLMGRLRVIAARDGSPSAKAGLLPGDFIRAIDGRTKMVVGRDHPVKDGDVIKIIAKA